MSFETEAVSNKRRLSNSVFNCRYIGLELLWSKYGASLVPAKANVEIWQCPINEFLEYFRFLDSRSLVPRDPGPHDELSFCIYINSGKYVIPAHNLHTIEVITNSWKEMIGVEKERRAHGFLIFGTTFPLFHVRPRALSSYLPIFLKLKKHRMLWGSDYMTLDKTHLLLPTYGMKLNLLPFHSIIEILPSALWWLRNKFSTENSTIAIKEKYK